MEAQVFLSRTLLHYKESGDMTGVAEAALADLLAQD
jgi:hypothetical protein